MFDDFSNVSWPGWETVRLIGRGSFGAVYEIERKVFDDTEKAALKVISIPQNSGDIEEMYSDGYDDESITSTFKSHLQSIVAEYSLMRKMNGSANIVNCDDVRYIQHDDGIGWSIFIKMELLTPLTKALGNTVDESTVIKIAKDMCGALDLCKKHGIVHRDIKPQNIFVSEHGDYKLGDFGIAKTVEKTMGGTKIGTYKYMAPEVYNNQPYGSSADIYSLGLVLYWLLNERRMPFMPLPPEKLKAGMEESSRHRRLSGEKLPEPAYGSAALKRIVLKACAYDPKDRYSSAAAMLDDLNKLTGNGAVITHVTTPAVKDPENQESPETTESDHIKTDNSETEHAIDAGANSSVISVSSQTQEPSGDAIAAKPEPKKNSVRSVSDQVTNNTVDNSSSVAYKASKKQTHRNVQSDSPYNPYQSEDEPPRRGRKFLKIILVVIAILALLLLIKTCFTAPQHAFPGLNNSSSSQTNTSSQANTSSQTNKTNTNNNVSASWSSWVDTLPTGVSAANYEIQTKTVYRSRKLETTSSTTESRKSGWELYDTVEANGGFGPWSDWSETKAVASSTQEVETQIRYRYREKETTTGSSSTMPGWELYDTKYTFGDYGSWSSWSKTPVSASDSRQVETKTMYQYRDKEYTSSSSPDLSGWSLYDVSNSWGSYGAWSSWSTTAVSSSESRQVETKTQYRYRSISSSTQYSNWSSWSSWQDSYVSTTNLRDVKTRTAYYYYYYKCPNCGAHMHGWGECYTWASGCGYKGSDFVYGTIVEFYSDVPYSDASDFLGVGRKYSDSTEYGRAFTWYSDSQFYKSPITQYSYRTRSTQNVTNYGSWSSWGDTAYSNSSTRQVETRTVYRYRDRSQDALYYYYRWGNWSDWVDVKVTADSDREVESNTFYRYRDRNKVATYYFYRWGNWTGWSTNAVSSSNDRQVETNTFYRYRNQVKDKTYYFRRWTSWSSYSDTPITKSETVDVQTKTQYRYKSK